MIKKGFSLAEILIALGIISIIATMGISIANRGVERAYDIYYYSAYNAISSAFDSAEIEGVVLAYDDTLLSSQPFINSVLQSLSAKNINGSNTNTVTFDTPSGISYSISRFYLDEEDDVKKHDSTDIKHHGEYLISANVPRKKTKNITTNRLCFIYKVNSEHGFIVPVDAIEGSVSCTATKAFANRTDLLPFYVDDGKVGRRTPAENGTTEYKKRIYGSLRDTYCKVHGSLTISGGTKTIIDCSGKTPSQTGSIMYANPRNL